MKRALVLIVALSALISPTAALAQTDEETTTTPPPNRLTVVTPYPAVAVEPGDQVNFDLTISAPSPTQVALTAAGVPEGWTSAFRGGGFEVDSVMVGGGATADVEFSVTVPADAPEDAVPHTICAASGSDSVELELQIWVSAAAGGEVTMTPDFPGLRSPAGETAEFSVTLQNDTPADLQFELSASGPQGWQVEARPASEEGATTLAVDAGSSENITVEATSPPNAEAGEYPITVTATAEGHEISTDLVVAVVGSYSMDLSTADQRLNAEVTVGSSSDLTLLVVNTGTAPLNGVSLSATPPSGWEVTFDQETLQPIPPGETAAVTATITPSEQAVAGDYIITFSASGEEADDEIEVRTTVNPSPVWGFLGVGLIVLTLVGLAWVFRRFGRR